MSRQWKGSRPMAGYLRCSAHLSSVVRRSAESVRRDVARSPRLATAHPTTERRCRSGSPCRQSVPVHWVHENHRSGVVMRDVTYLRPRTLSEAVQLYRTTPGCRPLAGGTDLMVMLHARTLRPEPRGGAVLDLWSLAELKGVRRLGDILEVGAAEPYTGIIGSAEVQQHLPALAAAARPT